jgi:type III secretion regulator YopN/LcrE/InvE/MxiC
MPERIDLNAPSMHPSAEGTARQVTGSRGSYRGETVVLAQDPISMIEDAAEELTFEVGSKVAEKELKEREIASKREDARVRAIEKIREYLEKVPDIGAQEKLFRLLDELKQNPPSSAGQLMGRVGEFYSDSSHQFVALEFLKTALGDDQAALRELVETAQSRLTEEKQPEITAGLNISVTAARFAEQQGRSVQDFRDFYRQTVLGHESLNATYGAILEHYGTEEFPAALAFLVRAIGDDLAAMRSSIQPSELKLLMDDLFELESLNTIHESSERALRRLTNRFGVAAGKKAGDLMKELLPIMNESWADSQKVARLAPKLGIQSNIEAEIYFLREVTEIVRRMPAKIFAAPENRETLLLASQQALDEAIEREENEE